MKNLKKLSRNELGKVNGGQKFIAITKCGFTATTTQDWTPQQAAEWRDKIEENYCKTPTYSGPDAKNLALN
jgi:hypothetical protein